MNGLKLAMVALLVACSALPALAEPVELEPVVVTATRTARPSSEVISSVTVITAEEIAVSGAKTLAEVLRGSVGLHVIDQGTSGSVATLSVRGSTAEQVLVLLNGVRLNSAQNGLSNLSDLPVAVADIERIEILRGPASALYGSSALGGVVQIFTRRATDEPRTRLSYSEGRYSTREGSFSTSGTKGDVSYQLGASRGHSNGYRDNSASDQTSLNANIGVSLPEGFDLNFSGYFLEKDLELPGPTSYPSPEATQTDEVTHLSLALSGPIGPLKIVARPIYSRYHNEYKDPFIYYPGDSPDDDRHTLETLGIELQGEFADRGHTLVIGGDFFRDDLDSTKAGDVDQERWSVLGQYEYQYSSRLAFLLGLRYDAHSDFSSEVCPRAGFRFNLTDSTRLRVSGGRAYRAPTLNQRFWQEIEYGLYGNPDLDPEISWEYEVAVDQELGQLGRLTVAGFDRRVKDLIDWEEVQPYVWQTMNVDDARIWGLEIGAFLKPTNILGFGLNYTYLHPKDRDTDEYLPGRARHEVNSYIEVGSILDTTFRLDGTYYNYYRYFNKFTGEPLPENKNFFVFDATLTKAFLVGSATEMELTLGVKNIFDEDYEDTPGYPMPPRQWFAGLAMHF